MYYRVSVEYDGERNLGRLVIHTDGPLNPYPAFEHAVFLQPGETPERAIARTLRAYLFGLEAQGLQAFLGNGDALAS